MTLLTRTPHLSEDGAAIARSRRDPEAFATVFDSHFVAVHRYIARRAGRDAADDLASQTFTLAFAHRERYQDDLGSARPWLFGIATNLLRAEYRAEQRKTLAVERLSAEALVSYSGAALRAASTAPEYDHRLSTALTELDPGQLEALLLHVWGELSYVEVAAALNVPVGTIRSRISRACAALRNELEPPAPVAGQRRNHA